MQPQRFELRNIDFLDIGEVRNGLHGLRHPLCNHTSDADHRNFLDFGDCIARHGRAYVASLLDEAVEILPQDATARSTALDLGQLDAGFACTTTCRGRCHHPTRSTRKFGDIGSSCRYRFRAHRRRRSRWDGALRRRLALRRIRFEHDELRTHRHAVARFPRDRHDTACDGRRNLDGRLLGHHVENDLLFPDHIAGLDVYGDDFGLDGAFTQIRHLEDEPTHATALTFFSAAPMRS